MNTILAIYIGGGGFIRMDDSEYYGYLAYVKPEHRDGAVARLKLYGLYSLVEQTLPDNKGHMFFVHGQVPK